MRSTVRDVLAFTLSLPLVGLPVILLLAGPAAAEVTAAHEAVRILAQARSADARCDYLSGAERRELSQYVARATLAANSQLSRAAAKAALRTGTAAGKREACSPAGAADVRDTLAAARAAIAAADGRQIQEPPRSTETASQPGGDAPAADLGSTAGLSGYGKMVKSYYAERKCRHLSKSDDGRFWKAIVRIHQGAVSSYGAARVAPVMRKAERDANRLSCGTTTFALVRAGFAAAKNN